MKISLNRFPRGPMRINVFASPRVQDRRASPPPPADHVKNTALAPTPILAKIVARTAAFLRQISPDWRSVHPGAYAPAQARFRRVLPPPAFRAPSAAPISSFIFAPLLVALRSRRPAHGQRGARQLGDRLQAAPHPPLRHVHGGPSPHLPTVLEALCRSSFLFRRRAHATTFVVPGAAESAAPGPDVSPGRAPDRPPRRIIAATLNGCAAPMRAASTECAEPMRAAPTGCAEPMRTAPTGCVTK